MSVHTVRVIEKDILTQQLPQLSLLAMNARNHTNNTHMHSDGGLELVQIESEIDGDGNQRQEQSLRDQVMDAEPAEPLTSVIP